MSTSPEVVQGAAVSRSGQWLREHRIRASLIIAVLEGLLVLVGVLSWWLIVPIAILAVAFWAAAGRNYRSDTARHVSWILASSQALVVLVPILFSIAKGFAYGIVVLLAIAALFYLFKEHS
jgi:hypothetical protein